MASELIQYEVEPFSAAFVFMDEAVRTSFNPSKMRTANTPALAGRMNQEGDKDLVFAHALVGPSDLLVCVRSASPEDLINMIKTKIRKNFTPDSYIHKAECHLITSIAGREGYFSRAALVPPRGERSERPMRGWILATMADPDPAKTPDLLRILGGNSDIKIVASVMGGYDHFIFFESKNMSEVQDVIDKEIRNHHNFIATDTRLIIDE